VLTVIAEHQPHAGVGDEVAAGFGGSCRAAPGDHCIGRPYRRCTAILAHGMAGVQLAGMKEQVPALRMMGLHQAFRETVAVDHVDLTVPSGSFFRARRPEWSR
jgi:hypothetical protein